MTSREFAYWLQGFFELRGAAFSVDMPNLGLNKDQAELIQKHLAMVFIHEIDPSYPVDQQKALDDAHRSGSKLDFDSVVRANPHLNPHGTLPSSDVLLKC